MPAKILVFVPAYNCAGQIGRVLDQLAPPWVRDLIAKVIVIDNRSSDGTVGVVRSRIAARGDGFVALLQNEQNYGLGGSHKVAFSYAQANGFDFLIVLHGDDQGTLADLRPSLEDGSFAAVDCLLGSRFMAGSKTPGYSKLRLWGNHVFNALYSACLFGRVRDLGAGLNLYRVSALARLDYARYPDDLTFNCVLLAAQMIAGLKIRFVPISWREDDQVSNVRLVRQSFRTLKIALRALVRRRSFAGLEHRRVVHSVYSWTQIDG
ncbi:glycosyltransferase family 2 protein [Devosia sp.]|uniref:glycosyltransferase family 2 protein n=1 Tax=Devosia sp. TaxID=1871048 RepID=UPI0032641479